MSLKAIIPGLNTFLKGDPTAARYFIQGKGEIRLGNADFKARGGEGSIYVKGSTAYKIYSAPGRAIPPIKIQELSVLSQSNIIRPLDLLVDGKNRPVGYSMCSVDNSYALCQLFPKVFRQRHNITAETTLHLVRKLQEGVSHVHSRGILIVDLNEMNFLVSEDFSEIFFIDVDSYQTPSYPATVLMESVRDRHAQKFTTGSDWFSFAVVSFQMFVGIHPFKGTYPPFQNLPDKEMKLDARMRANVSVLRPEVTVPASCLPFSAIPPAYLDWYRAVFDGGKRLPPPENAQPVLELASATEPRHAGSGHFEIELVKEFDGEIIWHDGLLTITGSSIYSGGERFPKAWSNIKVAITPRLRHVVAAFLDGHKLRFYDLTESRELYTGFDGEEIAVSEGQFYVRYGESIFAVNFMELGTSILPVAKLSANVMMKSTRLFDGIAIQNLLGAYYVSILPPTGACHQVRLPELDGYQIVDARLYKSVLMVVGAKGGLYDKFIFRFEADFTSFDLRVVKNISSTNIDFTVLASGIVLHMMDEGGLEIFSRLKGTPGIKVIQDPSIQGDVRLFHSGAQALIARDNKLYKFKMRRQPTQAPHGLS